MRSKRGRISNEGQSLISEGDRRGTYRFIWGDYLCANSRRPAVAVTYLCNIHHSLVRSIGHLEVENIPRLTPPLGVGSMIGTTALIIGLRYREVCDQIAQLHRRELYSRWGECKRSF